MSEYILRPRQHSNVGSVDSVIPSFPVENAYDNDISTRWECGNSSTSSTLYDGLRKCFYDFDLSVLDNQKVTSIKINIRYERYNETKPIPFPKLCLINKLAYNVSASDSSIINGCYTNFIDAPYGTQASRTVSWDNACEYLNTNRELIKSDPTKFVLSFNAQGEALALPRGLWIYDINLQITAEPTGSLIYNGSNNITSAYLGSTKLNGIYLGSQKLL